MIVVKVELWSAITGQHTELARMTICNTGESEDPNIGDYSCATMRGRTKAGLELAMWSFLRSPILKAAERATTRRGRVTGHRRKAEHVWNLVAKCLAAMEYGIAQP